ncbi:MAG: hypothetical protein IKE89_00515 [Bacilli bacterium]|nr:hypothetical protein [Bacilli bacterium]MBR3116533.1 hypothetical protein [Bacilli bacterium]
MIKVEDGKLQAELLDNKGTLPEKIINQYNYIEMKNNFEEVVDILATNKLVHALYQEKLKYEVSEDLEFKIFIDSNIKDYMITYNLANSYSYESDKDTAVLSLNREQYDSSIEMCMILLKRVKMSYDHLNEVEKFIIKSLEFDEPPLTDEELIDRLMTYKNGYYLSKKSAFIKLGLQLDIQNVKKMNPEDLLKKMMAEKCAKIVTIDSKNP